jgi:hypothetical protein
MNTINKDKFVKAKTFKTALKHLSKMIQEHDGEVFYQSDILFNIEEGLKKFAKLVNENEQKESWRKLPYYKLQELATNKGNTYNNYTTFDEYHDFYNDGVNLWRINIQLFENGKAYIDCGYTI